MSTFDDLLAVEATQPYEMDLSHLSSLGADVRARDEAREHGGDAGAAGGSDVPANGDSSPNPTTAPTDQGEVGEAESAESVAGSLEKTDQQDAIQAEAARSTTAPAATTTETSPVSQGRGGAGGSADVGAVMAPTTFKLRGVEDKDKPQAKKFPAELIMALRARLAAAAQDVLGLDEVSAQRFAESVSHPALVTSFLAAQLDMRLAADPTTEQMVYLFQRSNPLLGSLVDRLGNLEQAERDTTVMIGRLRADVQLTGERAEVAEAGVAYLITDRTEGVTRDRHRVEDVEIMGKRVLVLRDKVRDDVASQRRIERNRAGAPTSHHRTGAAVRRGDEGGEVAP